MYKTVVLVILDGYGRGPENAANAIFKANKPYFDFIEHNFPMTNLQASGIAVGQPWGEEGNSEVGHLNLGAGRIVYQYLPRITFAIRDGSFFKLPALTDLAEHVKKNNSAFHIMGLVGQGNVHSYIDHLYAFLDFAKQEKIEKVFIHPFADGRDSPPKDALSFYEKIQNRLNRDYPFAKIATIIGRHFAMDRDNDWDRTEKTYRLLTEFKGEVFHDIKGAIKNDYDKNITDEFIEPKIIKYDGEEYIKDNDAVVHIDFREDSARQLTSAFIEDGFDKFQRTKLDNLYFATMTRYEKEWDIPVLFEQLKINNTLSETVSKAGKKQIHIAETEKYAHVTYFFNGGVEVPFIGEDRALIPSKQRREFAENPAMSASDVTDKIIESLNSKKYDLIIANYANADMVGHTGNFDATVKAVETLDNEISRLAKTALGAGAAMAITSDHGNADEKINLLTGAPYTEHSANPIPFYLVANEFKREKTPEDFEVYRSEIKGILADVAPTILELLELPKPPEMTGESLLPLFVKK